MPEKRTEKRFYTYGEIAEILGCTSRAIQNYVAERLMPQPIQLGRLRRFSVTEIEQWISDGCPPCSK